MEAMTGGGVALQSWRDHGKWRVRELLHHLGTHYAGYSTPRIRRPWPVDDLIDVVGLGAQAGSRINRLSGGQRRRLDVAIGIVGRPEMLFLDEPTVGFDPAARREFHDLVHRLTDVDDTTVLLTTHDLDEAEKLADRIVILAGGRIGVGHALRVPADALAAVELGRSWRHPETFGVLSLWAVLGLVLAPVVLRRMARRESGSAVAARREKAMTRIG